MAPKATTRSRTGQVRGAEGHRRHAAHQWPTSASVLQCSGFDDGGQVLSSWAIV
jgi:hypothetical protein